MHAMRKARLAMAVMVIGMFVGFVLAGGASAQSPTEAKQKVTMVVGQVNDIRTINPLKAIETPEYETMAVIYDMLLSWDKETLEPVPDLATEWSTSEDGLTWTFKIREGVTWSDGEPVTAHDIAFTYNFIIDNKFGSLISYLPFTDEITAPDDTTLVWKTEKTTSAPVAPPWIYIMPEHIWGDMSKDEAKEFANFPDTVGSGPFRMVEWQKGDFWRLEANEDYFMGAPHIDDLVYRVFKNAEAMVNALKSGEIDFADEIPVDLFDALQGQPGITTNVSGAAQFTQLSFNMCGDESFCQKNPPIRHPAVTDLNFRLAVATAIDKQALVDRVLRGYGTAGTTVIPPVNPWHYEPSADEMIAPSIDEANRILDEAGYEDTDNDGVREMPGGGDPLEMRFIVRTEDSTGVKAGQLIAGWLKQIGVQVKPEAVTDGRLIDLWLANDYDLYIWGWGVEPDPDFQLSTYTSDQCGVWSDTCYTNPEYDQLYIDQKTALSREDRRAITDEMQRIIYRDIPEIVLYADNDLQAYRSDRWTGFIEQPPTDGYLFFQYGNWSYLNVRPVSEEAAAAAAGAGGISPAVWIGIAAGLIVVVLAWVMLSRRRAGDEDRA